MNNRQVYSKKTENYAKYRWDYAPEAIQAILEVSGLSPTSQVADIGSGTGILTRHWVGRAGRVFAIELNFEMQLLVRDEHTGAPGCRPILAAAETIPLPNHAVDLITVAQAIHWFDPQPTRREFTRILKPGGWLALLRNYGTDEEIGQALSEISTPENGVSPTAYRPNFERQPESFYFASGCFQRMDFPFTIQEDFETFLGSMLSASFMPDEDHPLYPRLAGAAKGVFDRFSRDGRLAVHGITELWIGQMI